MNQKTMGLPTKYYFIFFALIVLFAGVTTGPTIVSGYHIFILFPALGLIFEEKKLNFRPSTYALLALTLWALLATLINHSHLIAPLKAYRELRYYLFGALAILPIGYFIKRAPVKHIKLLLNLLLIAVILGFFVGLIKAKLGFDPIKWRYLEGKFHYRSGGFTSYMRYGYSSALICILAVNALFFSSITQKFVSKKWLITFILFNFMAILASETRGALLALASGLIFTLMLAKPKIGKILLGLALIAITAIAIISTYNLVDNRYLNINDGSNNKRSSQFMAAIKSIEEKPVFGLGANQFFHHVSEIKNKYNIWAKEYVGHSHNIFLEHAASFGLPGLILFILFLLLWLCELIKNPSYLNKTIAAYLVAFIVAGQVEYLFDVVNGHIFFFLYSLSISQLNGDQAC